MVLLNPYHDLFVLLQDQSEQLRLQARKKLIWAYSWAVPTTEAILRTARLGPIVELGAGTGYWAWLLRQAGADVLALDREPAQPPRWSEVQRGDASVLSTVENRALLLCWPPFEDPMALEALRNFRGERIVYIGEWNGRTADPLFHQKLSESFELEESLDLPCWPGFEDRLFVFRRRTFKDRMSDSDHERAS